MDTFCDINAQTAARERVTILTCTRKHEVDCLAHPHAFLTDCSHVDMLGVWYKSVNFDAENRPGSRNRLVQIDLERAGPYAVLSDTIYQLIGFRKSTRPDNCNLIFQLVIVNNKLTVWWGG